MCINPKLGSLGSDHSYKWITHIPDCEVRVERMAEDILLEEVEIESIRKMFTSAADTGHSN